MNSVALSKSRVNQHHATDVIEMYEQMGSSHNRERLIWNKIKINWQKCAENQTINKGSYECLKFCKFSWSMSQNTNKII